MVNIPLNVASMMMRGVFVPISARSIGTLNTHRIPLPIVAATRTTVTKGMLRSVVAFDFITEGGGVCCLGRV